MRTTTPGTPSKLPRRVTNAAHADPSVMCSIRVTGSSHARFSPPSPALIAEGTSSKPGGPGGTGELLGTSVRLVAPPSELSSDNSVITLIGTTSSTRGKLYNLDLKIILVTTWSGFNFPLGRSKRSQDSYEGTSLCSRTRRNLKYTLIFD